MILVLGGSGYVGSHFLNILSKRGIEARGLSRSEVDYTNTEVFTKFMKELKPEFVINCAGYTGKPNVDACEKDKAETLMGNAVLPGRIREACEATSTPWGHVSSGCIYSGRRADGGGFSEEDAPNFAFRSPPCSFYSGTKALGEEVLEGAKECFIWRLRIPFAHRDSARNYLSKLMRYKRLLEAENSISHLDDFVNACLDCWVKRVPFGIYNVTNPGQVTTRQVTEWILEEGKRRDSEGLPNPFPKAFDFFESEAEFMKLAADTPRSNCVMDVTKLTEAGIEMRPVKEAVMQSLRDWESEQ